MLTLLTIFFVGALVSMNPSRLHRSQQNEQHDLARASAKAGVEYALNQLRADINWRGEANATTVDTEHLVVVEDQGNVRGWLQGDGGTWSAFQFRFNHQDGVGGTDGLDDPTTFLESPAISLNNLAGGSSTNIPLGTGANYSFTGTVGFEVPEHTVALVVEGFVGNDIAPGVALDMTARPVSKTLEAIYQIADLGPRGADNAALMAGKDINVTVGNAGPNPNNPQDASGHLRLLANDEVASMRSKGTTKLGLGVGKNSPYVFYPDIDSEVKVGSGNFSPPTKSGQTFTLGAEGANDPMLDIEWSRVATSKQASPIQLPAGTYVVEGGDTDTNDMGRVKYYEMDFEEYRRAIVTGTPPTPSTLPAEFASRVDLNGSTWTSGGVTEQRDLIVFERDVDVQPAGTAKDLAIIPAKGAKQSTTGTEGVAIPPSEIQSLPPADIHTTAQATLEYIRGVSGQPTFQISLNGPGPGVLQVGAQYSLNLAEATALVNTVLNEGGLYANSGTGGTFDGAEAAPIGYGTPGFNMQFTNPGAFLAASNVWGVTVPNSVLETGVDSLSIPDIALPDNTVPQDLEVQFDGEDGQTAVIRNDGDIFLGTHLTGTGGALVSGGDIDLVGLGIDVSAAVGGRDGISLYSKGDINISTYDDRRNKYWDVAVKGVIFSRENFSLRLGEDGPSLAGTTPPTWGLFEYLGSIVVLGDANSVIASGDPFSTNPGEIPTGEGLGGFGGLGAPGAPMTVGGHASLVAKGVELFYEPKFLTPYVDETKVDFRFVPVSVVEH